MRSDRFKNALYVFCAGAAAEFLPSFVSDWGNEMIGDKCIEVRASTRQQATTFKRKTCSTIRSRGERPP